MRIGASCGEPEEKNQSGVIKDPALAHIPSFRRRPESTAPTISGPQPGGLETRPYGTLVSDGEDSLHVHIHIQFSGQDAGRLVTGEPEGRRGLDPGE